MKKLYYAMFVLMMMTLMIGCPTNEESDKDKSNSQNEVSTEMPSALIGQWFYENNGTSGTIYYYTDFRSDKTIWSGMSTNQNVAPNYVQSGTILSSTSRKITYRPGASDSTSDPVTYLYEVSGDVLYYGSGTPYKKVGTAGTTGIEVYTNGTPAALIGEWKATMTIGNNSFEIYYEFKDDNTIWTKTGSTSIQYASVIKHTPTRFVLRQEYSGEEIESVVLYELSGNALILGGGNTYYKQ